MNDHFHSSLLIVGREEFSFIFVTLHLMQSEHLHAQVLLKWCLFAFGLYLLVPLYLFVTGFPVWQPGWYVAQRLVKEGKSISECMKIIPAPSLLLGGPSSGEHMRMCVTHYANMKPDPEECKFLRGGLQETCLGRVWINIFEPLPCLKPDYSDTVTCNDEGSEGYIQIKKPQTEDCAKYKRNDLRDWCYSIRTIEHENIYECEKIKMESVRDFCEMAQAEKRNDVKICEKVTDTERRKYCEIKIDFWKRNPQFREQDYFVKQRQSLE